MRWLPVLAAAVAATTLSTQTASAQTAPPNAAGVSLGHIHLTVPDVEKTQKAWVDMLGGQAVAAGTMQMVKFPGIFVILTKAMPNGGTGSVVDHIGFEVKDFPALRDRAKAAGMMWQEVTANVQAFLSMPDDIRVEIMENKDLKTPVAFHHIHASVPDPKAAQAWYIKEFGAGDGSRRNLPSAMFPGGEIDFLSSAGRGGKETAPKPPTKGRALDHIGFEVTDLDAIAKKLAADGINFDMKVTDMTARIGLKIAFITDPNGIYIELTQGLSAK